jgi:hypothetical protein
MKTYQTNPGVESFETGGPNGLVRVEAGSPLKTDDPAIVAVLESAGAHAVHSARAENKRKDGEQS